MAERGVGLRDGRDGEVLYDMQSQRSSDMEGTSEVTFLRQSFRSRQPGKRADETAGVEHVPRFARDARVCKAVRKGQNASLMETDLADAPSLIASKRESVTCSSSCVSFEESTPPILMRSSPSLAVAPPGCESP